MLKMTEEAKMKLFHKDLYDTIQCAIFAAEENGLPGYLYDSNCQLKEILPMFYYENIPEIEIALELLTGEGSGEAVDYAINVEQIDRLYKKTHEEMSDEERNDLMIELGEIAIETLSPLWSEELQN